MDDSKTKSRCEDEQGSETFKKIDKFINKPSMDRDSNVSSGLVFLLFFFKNVYSMCIIYDL